MKKHMKSQYIPDLTERYPEGFRTYTDKEYDDSKGEEYDVTKWVDDPSTGPKQFWPAQRYDAIDPITGQHVTYTVAVVRCSNGVRQEITLMNEAGDPENYELEFDDDGNEFIVYGEYEGNNLVIEAE